MTFLTLYILFGLLTAIYFRIKLQSFPQRWLDDLVAKGQLPECFADKGALAIISGFLWPVVVAVKLHQLIGG